MVLTARRPEPLREAAEAIGARWVAADSAVPDQFAAVVAEAGAVDLVVHAAGVMDGTFVRKETLDGFEAVVRTNLTSAFVVAQRGAARHAPGRAVRVPVVVVLPRAPAGTVGVLGVEGGAQRLRRRAGQGGRARTASRSTS